MQTKNRMIRNTRTHHLLDPVNLQFLFDSNGSSSSSRGPCMCRILLFVGLTVWVVSGASPCISFIYMRRADCKIRATEKVTRMRMRMRMRLWHVKCKIVHSMRRGYAAGSWIFCDSSRRQGITKVVDNTANCLASHPSKLQVALES